ncbi:MAG: Hpt domain-containing protein [Candidatus Aminicenantes bacterium]|nr:Hpt domain-containing protein [Candidatus Aminicenantes bacterium]
MANTQGKTTDEIFMEDLKQEFIESVSPKLKEMKLLLDQDNLADIARIAHDIKGTAGVFGLDEGTDIAKDLQKKAQENNFEETKSLVERLTVYMRENGVDI